MTTPMGLAASMTRGSQQNSPGLSKPPEPKVPAKPKVDKDKLKAWIKSKYSEMKTDRLPIQRQWYVNYAMYSGNQYLTLVGTGPTGRLVTPAVPSYRIRNTINLTRPLIRTEMSRLTSQKPSATVLPATGSDDDLLSAQAGEQLWEYMQQRRDWDVKMLRNAFWLTICGTSFLKTWWDKNLIDPMSSDQYGLPVEGDVQFGVTTPFNLFVPDLLEEDIECQPYVFEAYTRPVTWVKKFYGIDTNPNVVAKNELIETRYFQTGGVNEAKPDSVLVIEAWIKPGSYEGLDDGGLVTVVGDEITDVSNFYLHNEYPYSRFIHVPTGKFYGDSVLVDTNTLQRRYNRSSSQITESKNRMARPQLLVAEGSIVPSKYTSEPGLVVTYKPGLPPPSPLPLQTLPAYVMQEMDTIRTELEDISGQHQASRGMSPGGGVVAATAISFIQEKDDSLMSTTYSYLEKGVEKVARQALQLAVDYYDIPRKIRVTGLDQAFDVVTLSGADIINGTDIRVEGGSALPMSKPARQAFLMDLFKMGAITKEEMLDLLEMGGVQKLVEETRRDKKQAQRENIKMKKMTNEEYQGFMQQVIQTAMQGGPGSTDPNTGYPLIDPMVPATYPPFIPVNAWDNHALHVQEHNNYRKGQEYEVLPDFVKTEFEKHVQLHMQALGQGMSQPGSGLMTQPDILGAMQGVPPRAQDSAQGSGGAMADEAQGGAQEAPGGSGEAPGGDQPPAAP